MERVELKKPVHNTITRHCLDNLLTFDGTDSIPSGNSVGNWLSMFVKSSDESGRYGVINACALGDGTGATSVNDTELKHRVTAHTMTKKVGSGWCGTREYSGDGVLKFRISHTHVIEEGFTVREIGWYNASYPGLDYTLSARVQLDKPVEVLSGEEFYSIYELSIGFQKREAFSLLGNVGCSEMCGHTSTRMSNAGLLYFPYIDTSGLPYNHTKTSNSNITHGDSSYFNPIYLGAVTSHTCSFVYTGWDKAYGFQQSSLQMGAVVSDLAFGQVVKGYVPGSFYRDVELNIEKGWTDANMYGFLLFGTLFRFGTLGNDGSFTPSPAVLPNSLKITLRQSWSTDLLTPAG